MSNAEWHSLGSSNGDWYYIKINEYGFDCDSDFVCDYEVFKNEEDEPITGDLPENIVKDIKEVIRKVKHEYREWLYQPDEQDRDNGIWRGRFAKEDCLLGNPAK